MVIVNFHTDKTPIESQLSPLILSNDENNNENNDFFSNTTEGLEMKSIIEGYMIDDIIEDSETKTELNLSDENNNTSNISSEKLVFPRFIPPPQIIQRRQTNPRPFNFPLSGPKPVAFQKLNTEIKNYAYDNPYRYQTHKKKVNNIQDILNEGEVSPNVLDYNTKSLASNIQPNHVKFTGTYRHPKEYSNMMKAFTPHLSGSTQFQTTPTQFTSDPFYPFKPKSPSDVNLMALNDFRFALPVKSPFIPNIPTYTQKFKKPIKSRIEMENIYEEVMNKSRILNPPIYIDRNEHQLNVENKHKPFSLMLDIYPMNEEETNFKTQHRNPILPQYLPNPGITAINSLQYRPLPIDNSYFSTINFPQLQNTRPQFLQNYNDPLRFPITTRGPINSHHHFNSMHDKDEDNPGKMVVHLNLYPKQNLRNKHRNVKIIEERSSQEIENQFKKSPNEFEFFNSIPIVYDATSATTISPSPSPEMSLNNELNIEKDTSELSKPFNITNTEIPINENINNTTTVEIIPSIQLNSNISFDNFDFSQQNSQPTEFNYNLSENRRSDTITIPKNHRPYDILEDTLPLFEKIKSMPKKSNRDLIGKLNTNEVFI